MNITTFDTLKFVRRLEEAGVSSHQAEVQAEVLTEAFNVNLDSLVTKEHLAARFAEFGGTVDKQFAGHKSYMDKRFADQTAYIDKRFADQTAYIDKRFADQTAYIDKRFANQTAYIDKQFADQNTYIDKRFAEQQVYMATRFADLDSKFKINSALLSIVLLAVVIPLIQSWTNM